VVAVWGAEGNDLVDVPGVVGVEDRFCCCLLGGEGGHGGALWWCGVDAKIKTKIEDEDKDMDMRIVEEQRLLAVPEYLSVALEN
jgi:hypothetical protein